MSASACSSAEDLLAPLAHALLGLGGDRVRLLARLDGGFLAQRVGVALGLFQERLGVELGLREQLLDARPGLLGGAFVGRGRVLNWRWEAR